MSYIAGLQRLTSNFSQYHGGQNSLAVRSKNIAPTDRTLTISVVSATNVSSTYAVFGADQALAQGAGVTVSVKESSHAQVRAESQHAPFTIISAKMKVSSATQFDENISLVSKHATGREVTDELQPINYLEPGNFQTDLVRMYDWVQDIGGSSSVQGTILAGVTVTFVFTIGSKVSLKNANEDISVVEESTAPIPSGMAPVRLVAGGRRNPMINL